jgi:hypothetical protein
MYPRLKRIAFQCIIRYPVLVLGIGIYCFTLLYILSFSSQISIYQDVSGELIRQSDWQYKIKAWLNEDSKSVITDKTKFYWFIGKDSVHALSVKNIERDEDGYHLNSENLVLQDTEKKDAESYKVTVRFEVGSESLLHHLFKSKAD